MVGAVFLKLHAAEKMDIRGMGIEIRESEGHFCLGNRLILLGVVDVAFLHEITAATTPACPKAELEKTDRQAWSRDRADYPDKGLLAAEFRPDIFAEYRGLKVGKNGFVHLFLEVPPVLRVFVGVGK